MDGCEEEGEGFLIFNLFCVRHNFECNDPDPVADQTNNTTREMLQRDLDEKYLHNDTTQLKEKKILRNMNIATGNVVNIFLIRNLIFLGWLLFNLLILQIVHIMCETNLRRYHMTNHNLFLLFFEFRTHNVAAYPSLFSAPSFLSHCVKVV